MLRTRLEIAFDRAATIAEVNALLARIGATIDGMLPNVAQLLVRIPDPGSLPALDALVGTLEADPLARWVRRELRPAPTELPSNYEPFADANQLWIDHQAAVRAPAAWNARGAMGAPPTLVIIDYFGDGPPDEATDYVIGDGGFRRGVRARRPR